MKQNETKTIKFTFYIEKDLMYQFLTKNTTFHLKDFMLMEWYENNRKEKCGLFQKYHKEDCLSCFGIYQKSISIGVWKWFNKDESIEEIDTRKNKSFFGIEIKFQY